MLPSKTTHHTRMIFFKQLVYKVKANIILEKLAAASLGSHGQEALLDLGNEAKENLQKIQVCFYFSPLSLLKQFEF